MYMVYHLMIHLSFIGSPIALLVSALGGATALHRAAFMGHLRIVQLLLVDFSANVMLQDGDGKTALHKVALLIWTVTITSLFCLGC